jgi:hypothetical protein
LYGTGKNGVLHQRFPADVKSRFLFIITWYPGHSAVIRS